MKRLKRKMLLVLTAALLIALCGCTQKTSDNKGGEQTGLTNITGTVATDGSTSMEKVIGILG